MAFSGISLWGDLPAAMAPRMKLCASLFLSLEGEKYSPRTKWRFGAKARGKKPCKKVCCQEKGYIYFFCSGSRGIYNLGKPEEGRGKVGVFDRWQKGKKEKAETEEGKFSLPKTIHQTVYAIKSFKSYMFSAFGMSS